MTDSGVAAPHKQIITVPFNQDISGGIEPGDILIENLTFPEVVVDFDFTFNSQTNVLSITFEGSGNEVGGGLSDR